MKRAFFLIPALAVCFSLCACTPKNNEDPTGPTPPGGIVSATELPTQQPTDPENTLTRDYVNGILGNHAGNVYLSENGKPSFTHPEWETGPLNDYGKCTLLIDENYAVTENGEIVRFRNDRTFESVREYLGSVSGKLPSEKAVFSDDSGLSQKELRTFCTFFFWTDSENRVTDIYCADYTGNDSGLLVRTSLDLSDIDESAPDYKELCFSRMYTRLEGRLNVFRTDYEDDLGAEELAVPPVNGEYDLSSADVPLAALVKLNGESPIRSVRRSGSAIFLTLENGDVYEFGYTDAQHAVCRKVDFAKRCTGKGFDVRLYNDGRVSLNSGEMAGNAADIAVNGYSVFILFNDGTVTEFSGVTSPQGIVRTVCPHSGIVQIAYSSEGLLCLTENGSVFTFNGTSPCGTGVSAMIPLSRGGVFFLTGN